jgi:hypothetical protein
MTDPNAPVLAAFQRLVDAASNSLRGASERNALNRDYDLVKGALDFKLAERHRGEPEHIEVRYLAPSEFALLVDGEDFPWTVARVATDLSAADPWPSIVLELQAKRITVDHSEAWKRSCGAGTSCCLPPGHGGPHQPVRFEPDGRGDLVEVGR